MLRARQTAQHVQNLFPDAPFEIIEELHEFTPFDFSQLPPMRPIERNPLMKSYWERCDPELIGEGIGAESFARFKLRVEVALARLKSSNGYTLAVYHGGVIKMAELLLDPASRQLDAGQLMRAWIDKPTIQNCGMRELSFQMPEAHRGA
jgi:broad specificity phosphatase PhoE